VELGLTGKTVLITGASRNIGRDAALAFAREGANLALCTSSKMDELEAVAAEIRALGVRVVVERCDVADTASVAGFVASVERQLGGVHVAINNAVNRAAEGAFLNVDDAVWQRSFEVNLGGPRNICRAVLPLMIRQRWGRIINFSGTDPLLGLSVTKGMARLGIVGFTRGLAREFAEYDITANCIAPGTIDVARDAFQKPKPLRASQPLRRLGKPREVVSLMLFLAGEDAGFITGQCHVIDGGVYFY
jgi:3-oxoacyl-[acyl-carrier protein] reductase